MNFDELGLLPVYAEDLKLDIEEIDLYPIFKSDLILDTIEFDEKDEVTKENTASGNEYEDMVSWIEGKLSSEQISVSSQAREILSIIIQNAIVNDDVEIANHLSVSEYTKNLVMDIEFRLMLKGGDDNTFFSGSDAENLLKDKYGVSFAESESKKETLDQVTDAKVEVKTALKESVEANESTNENDIEDTSKKTREIAAAILQKNKDSDNTQDILAENTTSIDEKKNETVIEISESEKQQVNINHPVNLNIDNKFYFYRLYIKSFKGDISTLDKEISQSKNYTIKDNKKELIEVANKNKEIIVEDGCAEDKLKGLKGDLESIGFTTDIQRMGIDSFRILDSLMAYKALITTHGFGEEASIGKIYDFKRMYELDQVLEDDEIVYIDTYEYYEPEKKKLKYTKNGTIKIPFIGSSYGTFIFTNKRLIISKYRGTTIVKKNEVASVQSIFEKKMLSFNIGQMHLVKTDGNVMVILITHEHSSKEKENEQFDRKTKYIESLLK